MCVFVPRDSGIPRYLEELYFHAFFPEKLDFSERCRYGLPRVLGLAFVPDPLEGFLTIGYNPRYACLSALPNVFERRLNGVDLRTGDGTRRLSSDSFLIYDFIRWFT